MGTFFCRETKQPQISDGYLAVPTQNEKTILVKYWYDYSQEMNGVTPITME